MDKFAEEEPTYDLGWDIGPPAKLPAEDTNMDLGSSYAAGDQDGGPIYDLGWGATTSVIEDVDDGPASTTSIIEAVTEDDDGPTYDLAWGQPVVEEDNELTYDLGWGQPADSATVRDVPQIAEIVN